MNKHKEKLKSAMNKATEKVPEQLNKLQKKQTIDETTKVPRITTQNVAEHREDILKGARKFILPLQATKNRIVAVSIIVFLLAIFIFAATTVTLLYRNQSTSQPMYQITRVIPYPVARIGSTFVAYENYLFELRHYIHYYENQQELSFESEAGRDQLNDYKKRALDKVVNDAYVKQIAEEQGITVSEAEVDEQIRIAREQNRLGSSDQVFEDVLRDFWDWSVDDFRRSLRSEILLQKVLRQQDVEARDTIVEIQAKLEAGDKFSDLAKEFSEDFITSEEGGDFGFVDKSSRTVSQKAVDTLFELNKGEVSEEIIVPYGTGYALALIQFTDERRDERRGSHIIVPLQSVDEMLNDIKAERPYRLYITRPE